MPEGEQRQRGVFGCVAAVLSEPIKDLATNVHTEFYGDMLANDTVSRLGSGGCPDRLSFVG